jgi:prevent-host-death family protein
MDYASAIEPISMLKSRSAKLVQIAQVTKKPVVITQNGRAAAVLMDYATFEAERGRLQLLQYLAQGDGEVRQGKVLAHAEARRQLARELKAVSRG